MPWIEQPRDWHKNLEKKRKHWWSLQKTYTADLADMWTVLKLMRSDITSHSATLSEMNAKLDRLMGCQNKSKAPSDGSLSSSTPSI